MSHLGDYLLLTCHRKKPSRILAKPFTGKECEYFALRGYPNTSKELENRSLCLILSTTGSEGLSFFLV